MPVIDDLRLDDEKRRDYLIRMMVLGACGMTGVGPASAAWWSSDAGRLDEESSIYDLRGKVLVNGKSASMETRIRSGDTVATQSDGEIIFAVGGDSFLVHRDSEMVIEGEGVLISSLRFISGAVLSVFAKRNSGQTLSIESSTATIGIRGSGMYMEIEPDLTYLCTCYGKVALASSDDPDDAQLLTAKNHDVPRYISNKASDGSRIREAPVKNHTDSELKLLETIVGRKLPPGFGKESYDK